MKNDEIVKNNVKGLAFLLGVIIFFFAMYHASCYACRQIAEGCAPRDTIITELSESLKKGIEEKYGYVIPDNAELISGRVRHGRESTMELYFSVELEGLADYKQGLELSDIYELMWDGKKSGVYDDVSILFEGIEEFEAAHGVEFSFSSTCDRVPHSGIAISEPKDGKVIVHLGCYLLESDWYD